MPKLYKHQQKLLDLFPKKHLLAWSCGTGKTLAVIELAKKVNEIPLIIIPKGLKKKWSKDLKNNGVVDYIGKTKETFRRDWNILPKCNVIVIDEMHFFANYKSKMSKSLAKYIEKHNPEYIWGLSGTPYMSNPNNIWSLGRLLGQTSGIWSFQAFKRRFFTEVRMGMRLIPMAKKDKASMQALADMTNEIGSVVKMEDCADFPEETRDIEYLEPTASQKKAIAEIEANEILVLPRLTRTHQILGGTLRDNPILKETRFDTDKIASATSFAGEYDKTIIVCRYNEELNLLAESITKSKDIPRTKVFTICGDTKEREDVLAEFEKCERATLIVNSAVSEGWESKTCSAMLFYSMDWSVKNYIQMIGRIKRVDLPRKLHYKFLTFEKTIDEDIYESVVVKKMDFYKRLD